MLFGESYEPPPARSKNERPREDDEEEEDAAQDEPPGRVNAAALLSLGLVLVRVRAMGVVFLVVAFFLAFVAHRFGALELVA